MDGKRIINVAYPRDPVENSAYNWDVVTAKALSDFRKYLLVRFCYVIVIM